jgi:hypothetical protein
MGHIQEFSSTPPRLSFASKHVPSSSEKRAAEDCLDEQALARMDDEGGSSSPASNSRSAEPTSPRSETELIDCESETPVVVIVDT